MLSFVRSILGPAQSASSDSDIDSDCVKGNCIISENKQGESEECLQPRQSVEGGELNNSVWNESVFYEKYDSCDLHGALYLVQGLNFECIIEFCEASFEKNCLIFTDKTLTKKDKKIIKFTLKDISYIRQHLVDAFQFLVRNSADGGEEYGFQLENPLAALKFRKTLYIHLLDICTANFDIDCAIAEYNTDNKEFIVISKQAVAKILKKNGTVSEYYIVFLDQPCDKIELNSSVRIISIESLSRDMQIWPSPQSYQITFWSVRFDKSEIIKTMFLMEMNPSLIGIQSIETFFKYLAVILQDRSFILTSDRTSNNIPCDIPEPMEDDGFDIDLNTEQRFRKKWRINSKDYESSSESQRESEDDGERCNRSKYFLHRYEEQSKEENFIHRFMEVGKNRTFVCRGNQAASQSYRDRREKANKVCLKVYKRQEHDDENTLETVGIVDGSKFKYQGRAFVPGQGLLHQQENKLLLAPESNEGDVYLMDIEKEAVIQHWNAQNTKVETMFHSQKQAQLSNDPTFLCTNSKAVFLVDTRMPDSSAKSTSYDYSTNPQISSGATDSHGHILLGSRLGQLRLFDGQKSKTNSGFKRAKTLLDTVKEPIIAVDVTNDGSWILATTKTFLVVFPTKLSNSKQTGFETPLGKQKPNPRYLMLSANDVIKYSITNINFAPAHFDGNEESIVTSTGNMAVVWDFETVKRGCPFYSVRFAADTIKDVQIPVDSSDVVVAYPTAVGLFGTEKKMVSDIN